jgi:hypothetical protein
MSIKTLLLAGALSLAAVSAALGTEGPPPNTGTNNSAAPACGYECPVLATEGGPGNPGDKNSHAELAIDIHSEMAGGKVTGSEFHASATPACATGKCQVLAGDGGPVGAGEGNGRSSAALSQGGGEFLVASIKPGASGDFGF